MSEIYVERKVNQHSRHGDSTWMLIIALTLIVAWKVLNAFLVTCNALDVYDKSIHKCMQICKHSQTHAHRCNMNARTEQNVLETCSIEILLC